MYNLLISGNPDTWSGEPWMLEIGRCVREYTDDSITETLGSLSDSAVEQILRMPCVFGYEAVHKINPHFGRIRTLTSRQGKARIEYDLIHLDMFISYEVLNDNRFDLDISEWELNRTHWAIKNVDLASELQRLGVVLPAWCRRPGNTVNITSHSFQVALSFPGEVRRYVESVAKSLERLMGPHSYFYDMNYTGQLARPNLDTLIQDIYRNRSRLVVVFLCQRYQEKEWCGIEFRAIRDAIKAREDRVMFVRCDDGQVDGVFSNDGYVDARQYGPEAVASFIVERLSTMEEGQLPQ